MLARCLSASLRSIATTTARPTSRTCAVCIAGSAPARATCSPRRYVSSTPNIWAAPRSNATTEPVKKASKVVRDEDIPFKTVVLVDPSTKALLPPSTLSSLLASLDRTRFLIQLADATQDPPICRIVDKKEEYAKSRERQAKAKERVAAGGGVAGPPKEVHLTWGTSSHDLDHKLKKGKDLLAKGNRVAVCLSRKKGAPEVSHEVRKQVLKQIEQSLHGHGTTNGQPTKKMDVVMLEFVPVKR
ncbi:hypothetical protein JCM10908_004798 [Rhodotorula pacifica]|uniref:uncharacterized protein n=1 Tax=Rhodotorula pacifica TaxID=1495444 RepID=UPI00317C8579